MGKVVADMMNHNSGPARCFHSLFKADDSYKMTTVVSFLFRRKSQETVQRPKEKKKKDCFLGVYKHTFLLSRLTGALCCVLYELCLCCRQTVFSATEQFFSSAAATEA